jgi:hypothetical protein
MRGGQHLYLFQMAVTGDFKVGRSSDVDKRLGQVQTGCPHKLRILLVGENLGHRERQIHQALSGYRCRHGKGEWFREPGLGSLPTEIYELIPEARLEDGDWWMRR